MLPNQFNHLNAKFDIKKLDILFALERECVIYNFLRKKHYKEILESVLRNKFQRISSYSYTKYLEKKDSKTYVVKPLIWIKLSDDPRIKSSKEVRSIIQSENVSFILIDEKDIPFYLLRKYGRTKGIELEIFSELKKVKKEYKAYYQELVKQERKKDMKGRKKKDATRKSRKTNNRKN